MLKFLVAFALAFLSVAAHGQTVASCPTPGAWAPGSWLPCTAVTYIAQPIPTSAAIADMRCPVTGACAFSWQLPVNVLPTDQVWTKPTNWVKASTVTFAAYTASAVISWTAPTQDINGLPVTLTGFNIYSGPSASNLVKIAAVNAATLSFTDTIGVGSTFFAITATDAVGESAFSMIVQKTLASPTPGVPNPPVLSK